MTKNLKALITYHERLHPSLTVQDVYKVLFQATMGPQHIMNDKEKAFTKLKKEFKRIKPDCITDEELIEHVSIDGTVARVNLRPYKRKFSDIEPLFNIMVKSAENFIPDKEELIKLWERFKTLVQKGELDFYYNEVLACASEIMLKGVTHITHSEMYRRNENPSYRVVLTRIFNGFFPDRKWNDPSCQSQ
ncbi:MAG: hypothetical protein E3J41_03725 [Candidatus Cloacimonadota bacterium]|nr:MAG: hypothetical protein E3J41_03725 [Candidatus Cloacimonadota bacterium]